jgi:small subunit ribosomal protein S5
MAEEEKKLETAEVKVEGVVKTEGNEVPAIVEEVIAPREVSELDKWKPKTNLGKLVMEGKITTIDEVIDTGKRIMEPEIIDKLLPGLKNELVLIGGRTGKGGGIERIPVRITAKMHQSGRRFRVSSFVIAGNENGFVGIGRGSSIESRVAISKALKKAKLNMMKIKRGCGSWECGCGTEHTIPFKTTGKSGSVRVELIPAPKGVGLVANEEAKKIFRLAGIKDIWMKSLGHTSNRINFVNAIFDALKKLYVYEK